MQHRFRSLSRGVAAPLALACFGLLSLSLATGCGDSGQPDEPGASVESSAGEGGPEEFPIYSRVSTDPSTYADMNGYQVPAWLEPEPGVPDSCEILTEGNPRALIQEPFAPAQRLMSLCVLPARSAPDYSTSLQVELRKPSELEIENGVPRDLEQFKIVEGSGIQFVGGDLAKLETFESPAEFSVWYRVDGGMALHAYWQDYILAVNVRGVSADEGLPWAKDIMRIALAKTGEQAADVAESGEGDAGETDSQEAGASGEAEAAAQ